MERCPFFGRLNGSPFDTSKRYEFQRFLSRVLPKRQRVHGLHHAGVCLLQKNLYETLSLKLVGSDKTELSQLPRTCRAGEL